MIGSHLVDRLISLGHKVIIIDDLSTGNINNVNSEAIFINKSITDDLTDIFDEYCFDYVFHLAAQINLRHSIKEPKYDANINIIGSLNIIEYCVKFKVKKVIFSSTGGAIYSSDNDLPFKETSKVDPESPYGLAKLTVENYLKFFSKVDKLDYVILRYSNVYGPRQNHLSEAGVISIFIKNALENKTITIFGDGNQTRDFINVEDVIDANIFAMDKLTGIYNVSSNIQISVNEICQKILGLIDTTSDIYYSPAIVGEMRNSVLSWDKINHESRWVPKIDLNEGLEKTVQYFSNIVKGVNEKKEM